MIIERVQIENLRGIREGKVEGLSRLSILVGPNNSGKSTVLEALWCISSGDCATDVYRKLLRRGGPALHALSHVVFGGSQRAVVQAFGASARECKVVLELPGSHEISQVHEAMAQGLTKPMKAAQLSCEFSWGGKTGAGVTLVLVDGAGQLTNYFTVSGSPAVPWRAGFVDVEAVREPGALEDAISLLVEHGRVGSVVKALKRAMPTLTDLRILKAEGNFILHAICGEERPIPAYLAGDGFKRFLEVTAQVHSAGKGGVVLLEEPESFQHPRYLGELATVLRQASAFGTQVILSTHSIELIDLLLADESDAGVKSPTVHRLRLQDGVLHAIAVSAENARIARHELIQDLRA